MLNNCIKCKKYSDDKQISEDGRFMTCPFCGDMQEINRTPLFIITGASGVGKSTVSAQLFKQEKDYIVMETDILWGDEYNEPENEYKKYRELWLRICKNISKIGKPVVLCGSSIPKQFENCVERRYFSDIYYLAIVCDNDILEKRLIEYRQWKNQEDIKDSLSFNMWLKMNADKTEPRIQLLDNSQLTIDESAEIAKNWIYEHLA